MRTLNRDVGNRHDKACEKQRPYIVGAFHAAKIIEVAKTKAVLARVRTER